MLSALNPILFLTVALQGGAAGVDDEKDGAARPVATSSAPVEWTILVYAAADNNADGPVLEFLQDVRHAVADDPGLELVLFIDRSEGFSNDATLLGEDFTGARLYRLREKSAARLAGGEEFPEIVLDREWEADSADPENLRKFIAFGKARFPARRTALLIYSHADGISMCPDEQARHPMGIAHFTNVVPEEQSVDFIALELCNMGGIEIAYQWRPGNGGFSTDVLLAIPNAGPPLDWDRIFGRIHSPGHPTAAQRDDCLDPAKMSAADFGRLAVEEGGRGRLAMVAAHPDRAERAARESVACYDLHAVEEAKEAVDAFAVALARAGASAKSLLCELRGPGTRGTVMNYSERGFAGPRPYADLYDLLRRAAGCEELDASAREAARAAMEATDRFVLASFGMSAYEGFVPGRNGVFIVFPDGDAPAPRAAPGRSRAFALIEWYAPYEVRREGAVVADWAWCRDGAASGNRQVENWFELLDSWFDFDDDHGGLNGYRF